MNTTHCLCVYCGTPYVPKYSWNGGFRQTCSEPCSRRSAEWSRWVSVSRRQTILGDVNKPARVHKLAEGKAMRAAVARFEDQLELV